MRRSLLIALLSAVALAAPAIARAFEGNITYELTLPDGKSHEMNYQIKGDRLRMNMDSEHGSIATLFLPSEKTMWTLMDAQKMAMKHAIPEATPPAAKPAHTGAKPTFKKTSRTERIAGQTCTVYTFKSETSEGEVCNAEGLGTFFFGAGPKAGQDVPAWAQEARAKGLFPLRTATKTLKDGKTMTMLAKVIEAKSLPDSLFQVPSDYKVMEGFAGATSGTGGGAGVGSPAAPNQSDLMKKMMSASPADRAKMAAEMRAKYGTQK